MSGSAKVEDVSSAIEESARLVGAAYSRDKVRPILTAFGEALAEAMVVFSVQTGERHAGQLDYSFTVSPGIGDPYAHALSNGFVTETDHPVGSLLSDIQGRWAISEHLIDCGAAGGLRKLYAHFPHDLQSVSRFADIPSMPHAVAENADLFARYGLDNVAMIGIGYKSKTMSLYFQFDAEGRPEPKTILSMLREIGLPEPNERMLEFAHKSLRANITLGWDSSKIVRVAFAPPPARGLDPSAVPARMEPHIERFATSAPRAHVGERVNLFAVKWMPDGEFLEVCSYYQLSAMQQKLFIATHKEQI
jgi:hypothetical protein